MEDEKIKIGIDQIQNIKMTEREKENILKNVFNFSVQAKKPIESPYSFFEIFQRNHVAFYSMATFLILILSGGGIAVASQKSLPGDALYSIKVSIVEPINSSLMFSSEEKAIYEGGLAKERILEAETLAYKGKLDEVKEKQINDLLVAHTTKFNKEIKELHQDKLDEKAYSIATNFQYEMDARAESLDMVIKQSGIEKEGSNNNPISITARSNAEKINLSYKKEVEEEKEKYVEKEKSVASPSLSSPVSGSNESAGTTTQTTTIKKEEVAD